MITSFSRLIMALILVCTILPGMAVYPVSAQDEVPPPTAPSVDVPMEIASPTEASPEAVQPVEVPLEVPTEIIPFTPTPLPKISSQATLPEQGNQAGLQVPTSNYLPSLAGPEGPLDLTRDNNSNQISDVVENEFAIIATLSPNAQTAEISRFVKSLPISPRTLQLQSKASVLTQQLRFASQAKALQILAEMSEINKQLVKDPAVALTKSSLEKLYVKNGYIADMSITLTAPNFGVLKKGDILARRSGLFVLWPWAMIYEHTGNYDANGQVFESNSDGVRLKPINDWKKKGSYVGIARHLSVSSGNMEKAVNTAKSKYGSGGNTKYNYNFLDKNTDSKLYCSQLSWKIGKSMGADLDSNNVFYRLWAVAIWGSWVSPVILSAVAPDEVMLSGKLYFVTSGWN